MLKIDVPETRGRWIKYNFTNMEIGEARKFRRTTTGKVLNCAKYYSTENNLSWKFRTYTESGYTIIVRVE